MRVIGMDIHRIWAHIFRRHQTRGVSLGDEHAAQMGTDGVDAPPTA